MEEHKTVLSLLTNEQIKEAIEFIITTDKEFEGIDFAVPAIKAREIGIYLMNLSNEIYLNEIIEKIEKLGLINFENEKIQNVKKTINSYSNSPQIRTELKAKYFGIIIQYIGFGMVANIDPDTPIPELFIEPKDSRIFSNLEGLIASTLLKLQYSRVKEIEKLPYENSLLKLNKTINENLDYKFKNNTNFLDKYLEYLEKKSKYRIPDFYKEENTTVLSFPQHIFLNNKAYMFFKDYIKLYIVNPYIDYSYLFQRMRSEKLIIAETHKEFIKWLYKAKYITEKTYSFFDIKGHFRTEYKTYTSARQAYYDNLHIKYFE